MKEAFTEKQFIPGVRNFVFQLLEKGVYSCYAIWFYENNLLIENYKNFNCVSIFSTGSTQCYEALSSDMQKNALSALVQLGAVKKKKM